MKNTIEEKVRVLQEQKQKMLDDVLGEESFSKGLEMKDIEFLFTPDKDPSNEVQVIESEEFID